MYVYIIQVAWYYNFIQVHCMIIGYGMSCMILEVHVCLYYIHRGICVYITMCLFVLAVTRAFADF